MGRQRGVSEAQNAAGLCNAVETAGLLELIYQKNEETGEIYEQEFGMIGKFLQKTDSAGFRLL